jgi:hypothetical protein
VFARAARKSNASFVYDRIAMATDANSLVQLLAAAGVVDPAALTNDDRKAISQLSQAEVDTLIQIARRVYPDDPGMVKITTLRNGAIRICVPL